VWLAWGVWRKGAALPARMSEPATRPESNVQGDAVIARGAVKVPNPPRARKSAW
jgi:hypothetical protein